MKKLAKILCFFIFPIGSCESPYRTVDPETIGYPDEIEFTASGGSYSYTGNGNNGIDWIGLSQKGQPEISGDILDEETMLIQAERDWLMVNAVYKTSGLNVMAQPNTTGKKRKMEIQLNLGALETEIKVTQSAK